MYGRNPRAGVNTSPSKVVRHKEAQSRTTMKQSTIGALAETWKLFMRYLKQGKEQKHGS